MLRQWRMRGEMVSYFSFFLDVQPRDEMSEIALRSPWDRCRPDDCSAFFGLSCNDFRLSVLCLDFVGANESSSVPSLLA